MEWWRLKNHNLNDLFLNFLSNFRMVMSKGLHGWSDWGQKNGLKRVSRFDRAQREIMSVNRKRNRAVPWGWGGWGRVRRRRRCAPSWRWWCAPWPAPACARGDAAAEKRERKVETGTWGQVRVRYIITDKWEMDYFCSRERKKSSRGSEEASPRFVPCKRLLELHICWPPLFTR